MIRWPPRVKNHDAGLYDPGYPNGFLIAAQKDRCYLCNGPMGKRDRTRDHVLPRARGGMNWRNILLAHLLCNNRKGDRAPHPCELIYLEAVNLKATGA